MNNRETNLLWLKDLLEHLSEAREQLEWAQDGVAMRMITESMLRDLESCRRVCDNLRRKSRLVEAVA